MPDYRIYKQWLREHGQELTLTTHLKKQGIPIRIATEKFQKTISF